MKFVETIRTRLKISKYEMASRMGLTPQGYHSLTNASESLTLKALVGFRAVSGLSDTQILNAVEREWKSRKTLSPKAKNRWS